MRRSFALTVFAAGLASPCAHAADPFTLIVVPDTQNYTDYEDINTQYNIGQMNWIRDNMTSMNIKFVMHLGDLQNDGNPFHVLASDIYEPDPGQPIGNPQVRADKLAAWGRADAAIKVLDDANVPYSIVPGNHDYLDHNSKTEPYLYLKTFGPQRYENEQSNWAPEKRTYLEASPSSSTFAWKGMNTAHRFEAGGYKFLNLALQYNPDGNDLKWAQEMINKYPGLPTIITTHAFVNTGSGYQFPDIFNQLIKNNPQIVMSFNGHLTGTNRVTGTNIAGQSVEEMLVDYQAVQLDAQLGKDYFRGGGVLHTVQFDTDANRVRVRGYSPIANKFLPNGFQAPDNDGKKYDFDASSFGFDLDLKARFGLPDKNGIVASKSFRQGVNGYSSAVDTYINEGDVNKNYGSQPTAYVGKDHNDTDDGAPDVQSLIRFNNLIGASAIPAGAQIESAKLTLHTSGETGSASGNTIGIYRLLTGWTPDGATWTSLGGMLADGAEALLAPNAALEPRVLGGFVEFDVTESIQTWAAGAQNHGWVLLSSGNNDWQFDTADNSNLSFRPQLDVTYRIVPEPATATLVLAGGMIGLFRRSRGR